MKPLFFEIPVPTEVQEGTPTVSSNQVIEEEMEWSSASLKSRDCRAAEIISNFPILPTCWADSGKLKPTKSTLLGECVLS